MRHSDFPAVAGIGLILGQLLVAGCSSLSPDESGAGADCITRPGEYVEAWVGRERRCVDPRLFATIYPRPGITRQENAAASLYPEGFEHAWSFSQTNLELFLDLQSRYGDDPTKVAVGIAEVVGFGGLESFGLDGYGPFNLGVYVLRADEQALAPSWETWFRILDEHGLNYPLDAQKALVQRYSRLGESSATTRHQDVVSVYRDLSGCYRETMLSSPGDPRYQGLGYAPQNVAPREAWDAYAGCTELYQEAVNAAGNSPYVDGAKSIQCFRNFFDNYVEPRLRSADPVRSAEINEMAVRAAIAQCQDASHLNTGAGLGYNTYPNPFVCAGYADGRPAPGEQGVLDRYTGREFIIRNGKLGSFPEWDYIELTAEDKQRPYLTRGWCQ